MQKILIPIDFTSASEKAVRYVENVFSNQPVHLELVSVVPASGSDNAIYESFDKFEGNVLKKSYLPYSFSLLKGTLLDEIEKAIEVNQPAYVIMGTHKTSLAKALLKLTKCPLMVIPEGSQKDRIKTIAYANDFNSVQSSSALKPLMNLSRTFDARIHIIHICLDGIVTDDKAESAIEYYLEKLEHEYVSIISEDIVTGILDYVHNQNIDLLTILIRDHGNNTLHSQGAHVNELVSRLDIPMLSLV